MPMNPSILPLVTELHRRATQHVGRLASPTARGFNVDDWLQAYEQLEEKAARDSELLAAALWFGHQAGSLRMTFPDRGMAGFSAEQAGLLAVAMLNRDAAVILERSFREARAAFKGGAVSLEHVAQATFAVRGGQQNLNADGYLETAIDATNSWLFDAVGLPARTAGASAAIEEAAAEALQVYTVQVSLNRLWQECLWSGWRLRDAASGFWFEPGRRTIDELFLAWHTRESARFSSKAHEVMRIWLAADNAGRRAMAPPRTVIGLERKPNRKRRFLIGRPSLAGKDASLYATELAALRESYLGPFLERQLPAQAFSCLDLHRVWHVVRDMARVLSAEAGPPEITNWQGATRWSLAVTRRELVEACAQALGDGAPVEAMLDFLTWGKGVDKGLWSAPLVPLADERWGVAYSVLVTGNTVRRTEIWLERGGLNDSLSSGARGTSYERSLRGELRAALAGNRVLSGALCAEHAVKPNGGQEIDLILKLGSTLIVGEVKCFLSPTEPSERFNYLRKLEGAAQQARTKSAFVRDHLDVAARALGVSVDDLADCRVIPLVVTNQSFGSGLSFDDCAVVDARFLWVYLAGPIMTFRGAYLTGTSKSRQDHVRLYEDAKDAEARFERAISPPIMVRRLLDRIVWTQSGFPTAAETPFVREVPVMGDVPSDDRDWALALKHDQRDRRGAAAPCPVWLSGSGGL